MPEFNLVEEAWVPVSTLDGRTLAVGLRDALIGAPSLKGVDLSRLTRAASLLRLLTAISLDVYRSDVGSWAALFQQGHFDEERIRQYFARRAGSFDLFDPERPFYQVGGLESLKGEIKSVSILVPEVATGNNVPLFSATTEAERRRISPAEAACLLLECLSWDTAALKTGAVGDPQVTGGTTKGNPTGPLGGMGVTIPLGRNLFETLLLSWPDHIDPVDHPAWDSARTATWETRPPRGVLDLLTWQSRSIRLFPEQTAEGLVVSGVVIAAGDRLELLPVDMEPHTAWKAGDAKKGGPAFRPVRHQPGKAAWRGLEGLLAVNEGETFRSSGALRRTAQRHRVLGDDYPLDVLTVGVSYGNQDAIVEHVMADTLPLPVLALTSEVEGFREALEGVALAADAVRRDLNGLQDGVRAASGGEKLPWDKGGHVGEAFITQVDRPTRQLLREIQMDPSSLEAELSDDLPEDAVGPLASWEARARSIAWALGDDVLDSVPNDAWRGRGDVATKGLRNQAIAELFFLRNLREHLPRGAHLRDQERARKEQNEQSI